MEAKGDDRDDDEYDESGSDGGEAGFDKDEARKIIENYDKNRKLYHKKVNREDMEIT